MDTIAYFMSFFSALPDPGLRVTELLCFVECPINHAANIANIDIS